MHDSLEKRCLCIDIPAMGYRQAWDLQGWLVTARKDNTIDTSVVLLLEHPPTFTLGRRGGLNNLTVSETFLKNTGVPVIQVERGGDITFHGPGQLIVYPIIHLRKARLGVAAYIENLEEVMMRTAAKWGIKAIRHPMNRGIWVGDNKLGSVGIAIRRGITFHGMALNVNPSLKPFGWINPCGLQDTRMTTMEREASRKISMNEVRRSVKENLKAVFGVELVMTDLWELRRRLERLRPFGNMA